MQGIYRIGGIEQRNVITNAGRIGLLNVIAGKRKGFAESIVVGIGTTPATVNDTQLDFIVAYAPIKTAIIDAINEKIYFKASLPASDHYVIQELGIYPGQFAGLTAQSGAMLNNFNGNSLWHNIQGQHQIVSANSKLDPNSIGYTLTAGQTAIGYVETTLALESLPEDTKFSLAYYVQGISDLQIKFKNDDDNYFVHSAWSLTNGYHIGTVNKSVFTAVGSPTWEYITKIEVEAYSSVGGNFSLDGMRYDVNLDMLTGMLSRAVLTEPMQKIAGISQDIEYQLDLDI